MKRLIDEEVTFEYIDNEGQWIERKILEITAISSDGWITDLDEAPQIYGVLVGLLSRMRSIRDETSMEFDVWFANAMENNLKVQELSKNASVTQRTNVTLADEDNKIPYRELKAKLRRLDKSTESIVGIMKAVELKSKNRNTVGVYQSALKSLERRRDGSN